MYVQFNLGGCHVDGTGVLRNMERAVFWFLKAARQGHAEAQYNLGISYDNGIGAPLDKEKAAFWWTKAAEQGLAPAQ